MHKLVGKPERKRPRGKRKVIWEDNIKPDLKQIGYEGGLDSTGSGHFSRRLVPHGELPK
jgi:hypothetical protein